MMVTNCTIECDGQAFRGITCEYLMDEKEISWHIGNDPQMVMTINKYFNENNLRGTISLSGTCEDNQVRQFEIKDPQEMQLNLNPPIVYLGIKR